MTAPTGAARRPGVNPFEEVLFEVKRTIVGQDNLLERMADAREHGAGVVAQVAVGPAVEDQPGQSARSPLA